jgi:hypothetical protein
MISQLFGLTRKATFRRLPPSRDPEAQLMAIRSRLDALELACAGLWELLKEKAGYSDEEIAAYIREVDMRDGKLDGRANAEHTTCPSCGRRLLAHGHKKCLWCGAELPEVTSEIPNALLGESVSVL